VFVWRKGKSADQPLATSRQMVENVTHKRGTKKHFNKNRAKVTRQEQPKANQSLDRAPMDKLIALLVAAVGLAAIVYFWARI
jgi:hypothetical protein